ncbi:DegV family protein [Oenococcus sicerae]|uniref:DegV family protein n=1 Tax=Oenococcus sicerae TaxID=2203724 RepID=A0AAJ1VQ13_9LACO|nr:DegV family protein [Oenococcus sicerae]MDN6899692.1 DegV family protein [Oenococcus sicerae]QAS70383.1 DegV family protein [Oenococcus sicerae]
MTEKIAILIDSCSDAPQYLQDKEYVKTMPMQLHWDGEVLRDRVDITPDEFYDRMKHSSTIPTTSSPQSGDIIEKFEELKKEGFTHVIAICISSGLSATFSQVSSLAVDEKNIDVKVINTKNIGIGSGLFAVYADDLIQQKLPFKTIVNLVNASVSSSKIFFYIPTLKYLAAGGRIGKVANILGSALNIKPIISCNEQGIYYSIAKARGEKKAIEKLLALVAKTVDGHKYVRLAVAEGDNKELLKSTCEQLKKLYPHQQIYTGNISPALGVHTGPGLIGVAVHIAKEVI